MKAEDRQNAIKELISKEPISEQMTVVSLLLEKFGIETNQAVVSRDLRKLGVTKKLIKGEMVYDLPTTDPTVEILKLAIIDVQHNEVMIVIKTQPALADFVGDYIDHYTDLDILGCLGGENVVFVTPRSIKNIEQVYQTLCQKIHFKKNKVDHV